MEGWASEFKKNYRLWEGKALNGLRERPGQEYQKPVRMYEELDERRRNERCEQGT
jgi:hypothetical protein